jgi:hypothetical protein
VAGGSPIREHDPVPALVKADRDREPGPEAGLGQAVSSGEETNSRVFGQPGQGYHVRDLLPVFQ